MCSSSPPRTTGADENKELYNNRVISPADCLSWVFNFLVEIWRYVRWKLQTFLLRRRRALSGRNRDPLSLLLALTQFSPYMASNVALEVCSEISKVSSCTFTSPPDHDPWWKLTLTVLLSPILFQICGLFLQARPVAGYRFKSHSLWIFFFFRAYFHTSQM